jgi:predicted Fe-Mo cluster-binding NifX family protein
MKIVITAQGDNWDAPVDPRFGRAQSFFVYDEESEETRSVGNSEINEQGHGAGPLAAQKLVELGADVLLTGNGPGGKAAAVMAGTEIQVFVGAGDMNLREALAAWRDGRLSKIG